MPGQLKDRLPNRALSGEELAKIVRAEIKSLLHVDHAFAPNIAYGVVAFSVEAEFHRLPIPYQPQHLKSRVAPREVKGLTGSRLLECVLQEWDRMATLHYMFKGSSAFRSATVTLKLVFHLGNHYEPKADDQTAGRIMGEAPLRDLPERSAVVGLERVVRLENPNIDRINHGLPIVLQRATPPIANIPDNVLPGEPPTALIGAPGVENLEFKYDPTQFPAPAAPVDTDISTVAAARLGVPQHTGA